MFSEATAWYLTGLATGALSVGGFWLINSRPIPRRRDGSGQAPVGGAEDKPQDVLSPPEREAQ